MTTAQCTRCAADVPDVLSGPPDDVVPFTDRDTWRRFRILMERRTTTTVRHTMRFRMFTRRLLPEDPADQLRETYTTLDLCDSCAGAVFLFAQGKQEAAS